MSRLRILVIAIAAFTALNTILVFTQLLTPLVAPASAGGAITSLSNSVERSRPILGFFQANSYGFAAGGWVFIGTIIWRGRIRSTWRRLGFEQDVFRLVASSRGARTRITLLEAMAAPKDRLQLANELGTDWNVVDRHVKILAQYGLVTEERAYGKVKFYRMTESGRNLLKLLEESNESSHSPVRISLETRLAATK